MSSVPTVFVVEPDASHRTSLEVAVRRAGWKPVTLGSAVEFMAYSPPVAPSCLVLGTRLEELDDFNLLQRISTERPETPVIVVSDCGDIPLTVRAMKAGAAEFLVKPLADEGLRAAAEQAFTRSRAVLQQESDRVELRRRYNSLSVREREVMARVVAGSLNKHVGAALGISEITVKAHRGRVMRKMGAFSLAELVSMALRLRLPAPPTFAPRPALSPRASVGLGFRQSVPTPRRSWTQAVAVGGR